ncbi:MAG: ornithine-acyl-ACP acyltransferase [Rhodobacteraceae bacterium]|nr:MAG: ornithine-acyl-ACP acyltransferase [Paracoccaceae bacterium]
MTSRYTTRFAVSDADVKSAQALRFKAFRGGEGLDVDAFDPACKHILVTESATGHLVCTFRLLPLANGAQIGQSYSAQFYDLTSLHTIKGMIVEVGRFCIDPAYSDPDILRIAWSAMTGFVDDNDVELLFGCTSFSGTDSDEYTDAFALLKDRHLAPKRWLPKIKAPEVFRFASKLKLFKPNLKAAQKHMPPLLRSYLLMGGWVSDHAVVDTELNTLHVFTGMKIDDIPANRKRLLRAMAG